MAPCFLSEGKGKLMKVIIVGGVAGGASCAARLRRLDEKAEILMVERGPYVSYANCGLPYHVGGVIENEASLLVADENTFRTQFAVDVRTQCEAVRIFADEKTVQLRDVKTGELSTEPYDKLVLSPGAPSVRPPLPGIDLPGIFEVRTVPDARHIRDWLERGSLFLSGMHNYSGFQTVKPKTRAVVVGGGFIGLETAENLAHRGFEVTVVEMLDQVLAPLDQEMARVVEGHLERHGVRLMLNDGVAEFKKPADGSLEVSTKSGKTYPADIVILSLGVRPDTSLAKQAALEIGELGGNPRRRADAHQQSGHLRRRRRRRSQRLRDRQLESHRACGPSEPAGPDRSRRDRRTRLPISRDPGHFDRRDSSERRPPGPVPARRHSVGSGIRISRRSTSTRTHMRATTQAPSRSP